MAFGISEQTIEEIKARTDLADLIAGYGIQVKRAGGSYKACCPFHHEKTPSFNIQPSKGFYHCFGCGESGDVIKFVMKYEGLGFVEAAKKLAAAANITIEETNSDPQAAARKRQLVLHAELAAFYRRCLKTATEASRARDYLASRDIPDGIAEKFQIGYAPQRAEAMLKWAEKHHFTAEELEAAGVLRPPKYPGGRWYSPFSGRVMFSIRDRSGRVIAFSGRTLETDKTKMRGGKYVNSPDTLIFWKSDVLYAFDLAAGKIANAKPIREAIVCEGQIDVIRCHAAGFSRAIASQGTSFTKEQVQILKKVADAAVLVFDADAAGQKAAIRTGGEMLAAGLLVRVASLPPGEDPDSLLRTKGPEAFQACLDAAESLVAFQVRIARAMEQTPDSYDAISRAARAVLALVRCSSSAVMRASLLQEASTLLKIPVSALEEDLERGTGNGEWGTGSPQLSTLNSQPSTLNSQPSTLGRRGRSGEQSAAPDRDGAHGVPVRKRSGWAVGGYAGILRARHDFLACAYARVCSGLRTRDARERAGDGGTPRDAFRNGRCAFGGRVSVARARIAFRTGAGAHPGRFSAAVVGRCDPPLSRRTAGAGRCGTGAPPPFAFDAHAQTQECSVAGCTHPDGRMDVIPVQAPQLSILSSLSSII